MPFNRPLRNSDSRSKMSSGVQAIVTAETGIQIALILPSAVIICWLIGAWADKHFHQDWISIVGVVFGAITGLVYIIQFVLRAERATRNGAGIQNGTGSGGNDGSK
jgi:uncharacterized membrane protein YfcA